mmetsp:Transcript_69682/g.122918  ORF Transcript_69682/g.122918 Transcript_69682/m.122918 type:complete len:94 (+) Transcript_69682:321-602(+)
MCCVIIPTKSGLLSGAGEQAAAAASQALAQHKPPLPGFSQLLPSLPTLKSHPHPNPTHSPTHPPTHPLNHTHTQTQTPGHCIAGQTACATMHR